MILPPKDGWMKKRLENMNGHLAFISMNVGKNGFGRMRRRGIDAVEAEQLEKIIAYNFIHMIRKEKATLKKVA